MAVKRSDYLFVRDRVLENFKTDDTDEQIGVNIVKRASKSRSARSPATPVWKVQW